MANDGFNGSTLTFPSTSATLGNLRSISFEESGNQIDVSNEDESTMVYVPGTKDITVSAEVTGSSTYTVGTTGALTVTWFDGDTDTLTKAMFVDGGVGGGQGDPITTSLTFVPTV